MMGWFRNWWVKHEIPVDPDTVYDGGLLLGLFKVREDGSIETVDDAED